MSKKSQKFVKIEVSRWWALYFIQVVMYLFIIVYNYDMLVKAIINSLPGYIIMQLFLFSGQSIVEEELDEQEYSNKAK